MLRKLFSEGNGRNKLEAQVASIVTSLQQMQQMVERIDGVLAEQDAFDKKHQLGKYDPNYALSKASTDANT